jgi:hypothetical protein
LESSRKAQSSKLKMLQCLALSFELCTSGGADFQLPAEPCAVNASPMSERIFPRSPHETMCGWMHLPRYIDKIRLHLAGKLHSDYQPNLGKGFDGAWLKAAGVTHEQFVEVVRQSITDGEVSDWVRQHVNRSSAEKKAHAERMLDYPKSDDADGQARLKMRKEQAGLAHRDDIRSFVDFIDADEKRI